MKLVRWFAFAALLAGFLSVQGCKKDDTTEYSYLDGRIILSMPPFVEPGFSKTFTIDTLMNMKRDDGGTIGYCFRDSGKGVYDTLVTADGVIRHHDFTVTAPNEAVTNTVMLTAFAPASSNYTASTFSVSYSVVLPGLDGNGSITKFDKKGSEPVTDGRDGKEYYVTDAEGLTWMRQNLAWEGAGATYLDCTALNDIFGRYYTWEEAQTACPEGWRLPSDADWAALAGAAGAEQDLPGLAGRVMGDIYFNGTKMWEYWREVKITDQLGLSAIPVGYATLSGKEYTFDGLYAYAAFWTADEADGLGVCRYLFHKQDVVFRGLMSKTEFAASVRCVRDITE